MKLFTDLKAINRLVFQFDSAQHPVIKAIKTKETVNEMKAEFPKVYTKSKRKMNSQTIGTYNVSTHYGLVRDCLTIEVVDTETKAVHIETFDIASDLPETLSKALKYKAKAIKELNKRIDADNIVDLSYGATTNNVHQFQPEDGQGDKIRSRVVRVFNWVKFVVISEFCGGLLIWCGEKLYKLKSQDARKYNAG